MSKKVAFCLSGGAAYGLAHLGMLKALEENGIKPDIIVGVSAGSLVGGIYAINMPLDEACNIALNFKKNELIDFNFRAITTGSLIRGEKFDKYLKNLYGENTLIENLPIQYGALATDLKNGTLYKFTKGELWRAVRASCSIPGIFSTVKHDGRVLVDGGVIDNLGIDLAKELGADVTICLNVVTYDIRQRNKTNLVSNVLNMIFLQQQVITDLMIGKADYVIQPNLTGVTMDGFKREETEFSIKQGYDEALKHIDKIKELIR